MQSRLFNIDTALLTSRCVVRRFREGEGEAAYHLLSENRSHLEDHFSGLIESVGNPEEAEVFLRRRIAGWLLQEEYAFGIWLTESSELIGYVHLFEIDWHTPKAEINYFIDREQTQQGLMTEVLARVVRFAFKQLELEKISLQVLSDNYPSQRLARRIGFQREGMLRNEFKRSGGQLVDLMRFGFARDTYGE
ncbi:GNAT family N-acetyltransferase [Lewinellaceae bacterium SD302]|nr:GNAT family N-acetyltransferase [Lewinellaceae bacterium SD302]